MALFKSSTILFIIQSLISFCISHDAANYVLSLTPDLVEDRAADLGITCSVDQEGHGTLICGTTQHLIGGVFFSGSQTNYRDQPLAEKRLSDIVGQAGRFVHRKRYYGAVDADVLEDTNRILYIVDLDVRMPESYVLGALKTRFWAQRGLRCASLLFKILLRTSRESFIRSLRDDFTQSWFVMKAWHGDELWERSFAYLVGAEDKAGLIEIVQTVDELCER